MLTGYKFESIRVLHNERIVAWEVLSTAADPIDLEHFFSNLALDARVELFFAQLVHVTQTAGSGKYYLNASADVMLTPHFLPRLAEQVAVPGGHQAGVDRNGVHFLLRYSIPLFIASGQAESKDVAAQLTCTRQDASISCQNRGTAHVRLSHVEALNAQGQVAETLPGLAGYVLPGQRFVLPFKQLQRHPTSSLRAYLNEHTQASLLNVHSAAVATVDDAPR
ncbi:TPA: molecular chaperone [Kluyvera georgiana]|uniref:Sigma-fimbriae chaperone protein n=1 Tax=Kluyvera georgiana ATCC 51603 TaxID=1354264 RepID=A0A1B7JPU3_9ENTR|nr:molecular chaperone [Kluyvera georgiana]OAT49895.1 sigma-fimbriae chaperone protein [Kluyvera georgiana ATCC 51603]